MYFDSLTIAALLVFVITVAAFVRFCLIKVCGLTSMTGDKKATGAKHGKQA